MPNLEYVKILQAVLMTIIKLEKWIVEPEQSPLVYLGNFQFMEFGNN